MAVVLSLSAEYAFAEVTGASFVASLDDGASHVFATHAPGKPNELFVVDQRGFIEILDLTTGAFHDQPLLDIESVVHSYADPAGGDEQGLLGLAFDPDFATNGYFYVNYVHSPEMGNDRTRIDRFQVTDPALGLSVNTETKSPVMEFQQDFIHHNGGWMGFSPTDGYLYISSGDGGSGYDPYNRAQSLDTRLGKILRIDVDGDDFPEDPVENYAVPADNPFIDGDPDTLDEIWAYGLRNPWRSSFDRVTGDLWIGDVGQSVREEIDFLPAGLGGANFGWRLREGDTQTTGEVGGPEPADHVPPIYDYASNGSGPFAGNSVVGGYVYRGPDPEVQGRYFFGDSFPSQLWSFDPSDPEGTVQNLDTLLNPSGDIGTPVAFAEDALGNLYILDRFSGVFRIVTDKLFQGDVNGDGLIDSLDIEILEINFGMKGGATNAAGDFNGDGDVDIIDLDILSGNFGATAQRALATAIPEPAAGMLTWLAVAVIIRSRRQSFGLAVQP